VPALTEVADDELVRRIGAAGSSGDPGAEAEVCRRFYPRARLYGLWHLRQEDAAEDLAQQALLIVLEAVRNGSLASADRLGAFLFGVCRNLVLAFARGEQRAEVSYPIFEKEPFDTIDRLRLAGCFEGLVRREQQVLTMSFFEEQALEEVARALQLSTVNARVIRHRAIAKLRDCMGGK
jgi:RNA polymerase sigma-70 factor (ECF subfamily)